MITATVEGPEDILEVFTRVNRGGAQVSGNDLYFAAVKTFWHDPSASKDAFVTAKEALSAVVAASAAFLDTWGALSLVSRLALVGLRESDMVPLKIDRLSRANKAHHQSPAGRRAHRGGAGRSRLSRAANDLLAQAEHAIRPPPPMGGSVRVGCGLQPVCVRVVG